MKIVKLSNNIVTEVIPDYALPVKKWYGEKFAKECIEAPDEVDQYWVYNPTTDSFTPPKNDTSKLQVNLTEEQLKVISDRQDFLEDCIAEMATQVYN